MLLMTPGPVAVDQRVIAAMNRPAVFPQTPEFWAVIDDIEAMLQRIFLTQSPVAIGPGSGRLALETAIVSLVEPGDKTLHITNGTFGSYSPEIARRAQTEVTIVEGRDGGPIDLDRVRQALSLHRYKIVTLCHSETSTGALYDPRELVSLCREHDTLLMVDAISSLGAMELRTDDWELDLVVGTSNKGLGALVGLGMVAVGPRAMATLESRKTVCQSWGLDLKRQLETVKSGETPRQWAVIPFTHLYFALQEACRGVLEEGLENRWARHQRFAEATRQAVEALGLGLFPDRTLCGNCVTAVRVPEGLAENEITRTLRERYQVLIGGSTAGKFKGKLFRISHQGVQASREMLVPTLVALAETLNELGHSVDSPASMKAFARALGRAAEEQAH
jgi:alanine-glyoxylate transaminase/serine-glyoxylate transaminase/serine-pyruvate transaminase